MKSTLDYLGFYFRAATASGFNGGVSAVVALIAASQVFTIHAFAHALFVGFVVHAFLYLSQNPLPVIAPPKVPAPAVVALLALCCLGLTGCAVDLTKAPQINFQKWQHATNVGPVSESGTVTNQTVTVEPNGSLLIHQDSAEQQESYLGWGRQDTLEGVNLVIPKAKVTTPESPPRHVSHDDDRAHAAGQRTASAAARVVIDPRPYFPALTAAYGLPGMPALPPGIVLLDVIRGRDWNGLQPYATVVRMPDGQQVVSFRGTNSPREWVEDFNVVPEQTPEGVMSAGIAITYDSLAAVSGAPLSSYAGAIAQGHSRGAPLAAAWAGQYASPAYILYACPRLLGSAAIGKLAPLNGTAYQIGEEVILGDVVPLVFVAYPALPNVTHLIAPAVKPFDVDYHHDWTTYQAAIAELYRNEKAA